MNDDDPDALEMFLEWLYTMDSGIACSCFYRHGINGLMHLGQQAVKYDQPLLLETILRFIELDHGDLDFQESLVAWKEACNMNDNFLINRMKDALVKQLTASDELSNLDCTSKDILRENPDVGIELLQRVANKAKEPKPRREAAPPRRVRPGWWLDREVSSML